jgi:bifunctional non-homologous end joining protein LigD
VHEIKFDGYRMQGRLSANRATLFTRHGLDWTERFAPIARALEGLPADNLIVDGEIVVQDARGISSFSALQETLKSGKGDFLYYVFDLLYLDGYDLTGAAFIDRKGALQQLCVHVPKGSAIIVSEHFDTAGPVLLKHACEMGLEGIISKKVHAQYHSGRVGDWLKIKCAASQEFIVAGYEPSDTGARTIRSLILGYYEGGQMRYAGRVGTGFTVAVERDLMTKVRPLVNNTMPFEKLPEEERRRKVRWLEPKLVAEIEFRGWTHGNVLRQASFKGLREDKPAREVVREKMMRVAAPQRKTAQPSGAPGVSSAAPFVARSRSVSVAGVALTHPDRVYWDDVGITKQMLAEYYEQVWDWIAPHLVDRPLALVRCPEGTAGECFFQKHASGGLEYAKLRRIPATGDEPWIAVETLQGLIGLAQAGVLEIHTWGTVADEMHTCNRLVFDLDPGPGVTWEQLKTGVRELRDVLGSDKLTSFLKATGGKGLHVVVPIAPTPWDEAKNFAHAVALAMARDDPRRFTANMAKRVRDNRIFVDYLRNDEGATAIAPYSTRARPGATIAVPLSWDELGRLEGPNTYNVLNIMKRLGRKRSDPWKDISRLRQKVPNGKAPKR